MIRIEFTDDDVARTRLALSPLWELAAALFTLHRTEIPVEHAAWAERTRAAMTAADLGPLDPRVAYRHRCPDFMAPIPSDPLADVEDEIERVRATDPAVMVADIAECWPEGPPEPWDRFARSPREMADRLADALHAFWRIALADDWPRLRAVLEGEVLGRARSLATAGPAAVLDEIHPRVALAGAGPRAAQGRRGAAQPRAPGAPARPDPARVRAERPRRQPGGR